MALIPKYGTPSLSSPTPSRENTLTGLHAGEAIKAGDICGIETDGRILRATADLTPRGIAAGDAAAGEPLTLYVGVNFHYGQNLPPGVDLFLGAAPGSLDDADASGTADPIGYVVDRTRIRFHGRG